jgi:hypothetical protein
VLGSGARMSRQLRRSAFVVAAVSGAATACAASRAGEIEPRYVAVHNALATLGLAQIGPIHRGSLAEGREARMRLELPAGCATVVALGGIGVRDLEVTLLDADDEPLARDMTRDPEAALRACPERAGPHTLVVRMAAGAGDYVAATWTGGSPAPGAATAPAVPIGAGTCDSPLALAAGVTAGNTRRGEPEHAGSCATSDAKELVYRLEVPRRQRVTLDVDARFDSVLHLRKDDCADPDAEIACNDDATAGKKGSGARSSRIDEILEPGIYYVLVDGYANEVGAFTINVTMEDAPTLAASCARGRPVAAARTVGTLDGAFDNAGASCGQQAPGPDVVHRLQLRQRARVRITERSDDFSPVVHLRRTCTDERSEVGCSEDGIESGHATFVGVLDPGAYAVFADATEKEARGAYTLDAEVGPEAGSGAPGDACADAVLLRPNGPVITGDTFLARDDVGGKCSAAGAPDLLYRFELTKRARVTARFTGRESEHVFVVLGSCVDRASEVACTETLDDVFPPGVHYLAVDGAKRDSFGRFGFTFAVRDVAGQENACRTAPLLVAGQTVQGSTAGAGDRFRASCAGREEAQASGDRIYKLVLRAKTRVRLSLSTPSWDGVLTIRRACIDPPNARSVRAAELACNNDFEDSRHSRIETTLDAGTYFVLVDGHMVSNEGPFTLEYQIVP